MGELPSRSARQKRALFARLDAIEAGKLPREQIGSRREEAIALGIGTAVYTHWGLDWVSIHHPEVPPDQRRARLAEYFGKGARKWALFARLDAIEAGKVPPEEIGTLKEEAEAIDTSETGYFLRGVQWVTLRHPEVPPDQRRAKLAEYHGWGPHRKGLFARLDAIEANQVPLTEIGTLEEEANKLSISQTTYYVVGEHWVATRHPEVMADQRRAKLAEYYGYGICKKALFARLDGIEAGTISYKDVYAVQHEAPTLGMSVGAYMDWGEEWVEARHPEVPPDQRRAKLAECSGWGPHKKALFARLDAIDAGKVPVDEIGPEVQEAATFDISIPTYVDWGVEWVGLRHPEIPVDQRQEFLKGYRDPGTRKKALFARLDAITLYQIPVKEIGSAKNEACSLGISSLTFFKWGQEWVAFHHPEVVPEQRRNKLAEYYGDGIRKRNFFNRLDAIEEGKVPVTEMGTVEQELELLDISNPSYYQWGEEWVATRHAEIAHDQRRTKLKEVRKRGVQKRLEFERLDAIEEGKVPPNEIGTQEEEFKRLNMGWRQFYEIGLKWIALRHPKIPEDQRHVKFAEYYGLGARRRALFIYLDAMEAGKVPPREIRSFRQEIRNLNSSQTSIKTWGLEWVSLRHPEVPPDQRNAKLREYFGLEAKKRSVFQRLEAIEKGEIPITDVGFRPVEAENLGINLQTFTVWGQEWVASRHPEVPPDQQRAKLAEYYGLGVRRRAAHNLGQNQIDRFERKQPLLPIRELARLCDTSTTTVGRAIRKELNNFFLRKGQNIERALKHAEQTFRKMYPIDAQQYAGKYNHTILEHGAIEVVNAIPNRSKRLTLTAEKPEPSIQHDLLLEGVQEQGWLQVQFSRFASRTKTFSEIMRIPLDQLGQYKRVSIDFTISNEPKKLRKKARKYARSHTLLLVVLTAGSPNEWTHVIDLWEHPNMRVISAELLFSLIGAKQPALDKVRKCCRLTRLGKLNQLEVWARAVKRGNAPSFLQGQVDLGKWLADASQACLKQQVNAAIDALQNDHIPPDIEILEHKLRDAGHTQDAAALIVAAAIGRVKSASTQSSQLQETIGANEDHIVKSGARGIHNESFSPKLSPPERGDSRLISILNRLQEAFASARDNVAELGDSLGFLEKGPDADQETHEECPDQDLSQDPEDHKDCKDHGKGQEPTSDAANAMGKVSRIENGVTKCTFPLNDEERAETLAAADEIARVPLGTDGRKSIQVTDAQRAEMLAAMDAFAREQFSRDMPEKVNDVDEQKPDAENRTNRGSDCRRAR